MTLRTALIAGMLGALGAVLCTAGAGAQDAGRVLPAFPGAEGFGMFTKGGRGGAVHLVTTLADYGAGEQPVEGSLRAAVEAKGPRTVVFRVAGYVELKRPLVIRHPFITIAGQTAPGEGITLKNFGVEIDAREVILRHVRIRPGDVASTEQDAVNIRASNVIIDHCSVSWATDETLSVIDEATNVTIQWCLITESLNESVHHKGAHGYGSLLTTTGDVTIHHTAYAFHHSRNPRPKDVLLDFRNNLIYGYGDAAGYNAEDFTRMNYVGNYIVPLAYSDDPACAFELGGLNTRIFAEGNRLRGAAHDLEGWELICPPETSSSARTQAAVRVAIPFAAHSVSTDPPEVAYQRILAEAGATRPTRDAVDRRVLAWIEAGQGRIIDSQDEVGGWRPLEAGWPYRDTDRDGMADAWEAEHGLDAADASDQACDADRDGYTNLEEFLNGTHPLKSFPWVPPPVMQPPTGTAFTDSTLLITVIPAVPGVPIYVTTDGREPTSASPRYDAPLRLTGSVHVRAKALQESMQTTAAFAVYEKLSWLEAIGEQPDRLAPGLHYAYYETDDWDDGPPPEELEPVATGAAQGLHTDLRRRDHGYGLLFEGFLKVPRDGIYTFFLTDNYRSRLYLDDTLVTVGKTAGGMPGRVALRAGGHRFHLRSLHEEAAAPFSLEWEGPGIQRQPIPQDTFLRAPTDPVDKKRRHHD